MTRRARWLSACALAALLAAGTAWWGRDWLTPLGRLVDRGQQALAAQHFRDAERWATRALDRDPTCGDALLVRAAAFRKLGRRQDALADYARLAAHGGSDAVAGWCEQGALWLELGNASQAESCFRRALALDPERAPAHRRLAFLLSVEGRRWEASPHYFALLRQGKTTPEELLLLGDLALDVRFPAQIEKYLQTVPEDPLPLLAKARLALRANHLDSAAAWLRQIVAAHPQQLEAQAWLGWVLVERRSRREFLSWHARLPPGCDEHPGTWLARGLWADHDSDHRGAARCFWEALRLDPNHQAANYRLSQALTASGDAAACARFGERARQLERLSVIMGTLSKLQHDLAASPVAVTTMREAARLTEALGRRWEAWGWCRALRELDPDMKWARREFHRLDAEIQRDPPRELVVDPPASWIDLSSWPLPGWMHGDGNSTGDAAAASGAQAEVVPGEAHGLNAACRVKFEEVAVPAGIRFTYFNSPDPATEGARILESTGGGVAVLDYDADGWPELYLTQGCPWPPHPGQTEFVDRLFCNLHDGRFQDRTHQAGLGDERFSQGVAAGDYDQDGFPDLYLANIGENRLYRNNGDGTFSDITRQAGIGGDRWTTSCLMADLNSDGWPDLYDVTYVEGKGVYDHICDVGGVARACVPLAFQPQADRVWLNLGDGRFQDQSVQAGIQTPGGNGLGIVAADFGGAGRLSLFVANDMTANFFFVNRAQPGQGLSFVEEGVISGLAYDRDGRAQACMGVAADDANGDGLVDLFVTNFYNESNTLYLALRGELFVDGTREAGLREPSYELLGFGAQFLDGELDGRPDLVVANGHIDDFTFQGIPYRMPPQYFQNVGQGRFVEGSAASLGAYFEGNWLGRGLARWDWNRDGLEEFVVSHLDTPAAALVNRTGEAGHYLAVRLCGVVSSRDAIGTTITLSAGELTRTRQLTAGDGYQASNERKLVFGLGDAARIDELVVRWPSGLVQVFRNLPVDQEVLLIESNSASVFLPAPDR